MFNHNPPPLNIKKLQLLQRPSLFITFTTNRATNIISVVEKKAVRTALDVT